MYHRLTRNIGAVDVIHVGAEHDKQLGGLGSSSARLPAAWKSIRWKIVSAQTVAVVRIIVCVRPSAPIDVHRAGPTKCMVIAASVTFAPRSASRFAA